MTLKRLHIPKRNDAQQGHATISRSTGLAYITASSAGGVVMGGVIGVVGLGTRRLLNSVGSEPRLIVSTALLLAALSVVRDRGIRFQIRRQVPRQWTRQRPVVMALGFGLLLGLGYVTYLAVPAMYVLALGMALVGSHSPLLAIAVGGCYGLSRASSVLGVRWTVGQARETGGRGSERDAQGSGPNPIVVASLSLANRWRQPARLAGALVGLVLALATAIGI